MAALLLAHRGHRAAGPENSLRSIVAAFRVADGAEVDVLVTADGVPVLRHDERLPDGTPVRSLDLATLRRRLGASDDDLPEFAAVLNALGDQPRKAFDVELKVPGAARAIHRAGIVVPAWAFFTSFYAAEAMEASALFPDRVSGLLVSHAPIRFVPPRTTLLSVRHPLLPEVAAAHPDLPLSAWTVNDEAAARRAAQAQCTIWVGDDVEALARFASRVG